MAVFRPQKVRGFDVAMYDPLMMYYARVWTFVNIFSEMGGGGGKAVV